MEDSLICKNKKPGTAGNEQAVKSLGQQVQELTEALIKERQDFESRLKELQGSGNSGGSGNNVPSERRIYNQLE